MNRRPVEQLIINDSPVWTELQEAIRAAPNLVEVIPPGEHPDGDLHQLQVTTASTLGTVVYHTGGLLVDHGWIRVLGSESERMGRSIIDWNSSRGIEMASGPPPMLFVADDVLGGLFALNGGVLPGPVGEVFYLPPSETKWESMGRGYSAFIEFMFRGDLSLFYKDFRWPSWQEETANLRGDRGILIYPFTFAEGPPIEDRHRSELPLSELVLIRV